MGSLERKHGKSYPVKKEFFFTNSGGGVGGPIVNGLEAENLQGQFVGEKIMGWDGKYSKEINAAASKYGVDPFLVAAVIYAESSFNPGAGSGAGAKGLMQLMPDTFKAYGNGNILDPKDNINAGTKYLYTQIKAFGKVELGLAAYNAGPGAVKKYKGIPPYTETKNYVKKVMAKWAEYKGGKVEGSTAVADPAKEIKTGNTAIDGLLKTPVIWVALLVAFLLK
jgi:hypothetical protein